jgi:acyl-coenzyme A thioesterase PaaI-like protein
MGPKSLNARPPVAACPPACVGCRSRAAGGLGLTFEVEADGSVRAEFACDAASASYPDRVNGGLLALLADAAMAHCLFQHGLPAVTGRLNVGFREPLLIGPPAQVRAFIQSRTQTLVRACAEFRQHGRVKARAEGKFLLLPADPGSAPPRPERE